MPQMAELPQRRLTAIQAKAKADECREIARCSAKAEHRVMLHHMAETWERIALSVADQKRGH